MGAESFIQTVKAKTAKQAFKLAVDQAAWNYGHAGYTGTIAEKSEFVLIPVPPEWELRKEAYAEELIDKGDERIDDKWGPAGCIQISNNEWLFFGWASS